MIFFELAEDKKYRLENEVTIHDIYYVIHDIFLENTLKAE